MTAPEPSTCHQRPPRTGYNDDEGIYHPGPDYDSYNAHADTCVKCDNERRGDPPWARDVPIPQETIELAAARLVAPWWKRVLAFFHAATYPGEVDDLRKENRRQRELINAMKEMLIRLNEENSALELQNRRLFVERSRLIKPRPSDGVPRSR